MSVSADHTDIYSTQTVRPNMESPFPAWRYLPPYLPDPLVMHLGEAGVEEPMWVYLDFMQRCNREQQFVEHPIGIREITNFNSDYSRAASLHRVSEHGRERNSFVSRWTNKYA